MGGQVSLLPAVVVTALMKVAKSGLSRISDGEHKFLKWRANFVEAGQEPASL
jgi:hypothetical protein